MLHAVIIDDEPDGIANLSFYLEKTGAIKIVHTFCDAEAAIRYLNEHRVNVVFLDIQLKDRSGFELLEQLSAPYFSLVFVTAYDQYAIRAFKANAIDYLLKPIDEDELRTVIRKIKKHLALNTFEDPKNLKDDHRSIYIRESGFPVKIATSNIIYIEASGSYSKLFYLAGKQVKSVVLSKPIAELEAIVGSGVFFRTHKSYLVNIRYFMAIESNTFSNTMHLEHGCVAKISRRRLKDIRSILAALPPPDQVSTE